MTRRRERSLLLPALVTLLVGCERASTQERTAESPEAGAPPRGAVASSPDEPSPLYRNVQAQTAYVGDGACTPCHEEAASAYGKRAMSRSFHPWTPEVRVETVLDEPLHHTPTGFYYSVVQEDGHLFQEEYLVGQSGEPLHRLRRRMDWVMGSGNVARTYFTVENGRLFQLPLTWYRDGGWDFSPGYELNNARFDRLMPDGCIACHGSYPEPIRFLEGKYAKLPTGIGCERCHGPGALHVNERSTGLPQEGGYDDTIVDPAGLPFERRLDVCEQCHVHTPVTVLREGRDAFSYLPSQPLSDHVALFKVTGSIDIVSHADRLRQSECFIATRPTASPLECASCHDPHRPATVAAVRNEPCGGCHTPAALEARLASHALPDHGPAADCVSCHMPRVRERTVPHGTFTDHWIRVVTPTPTSDHPAPGADGSAPRADRAGRDANGPIEPYFERDRTGPEADIYQGMGEVVYAMRTGDTRLLSDAAASLEGALASDTTRGEAHLLLGLAYRQIGKPDDAIRALERSVAAGPERPQRLHALARAYEIAAREPSEIASLYERALELQPALAWIRADYADFLRAHGRRNEAREAYRLALAERPGLAVAAFNLGALLIGQGLLGEASEAFQRAVHLSPAFAEALTPLFQIRTTGTAVTGLRAVRAPLGILPVRERESDAVRVAASPGVAEPRLLFLNVPRGASLRVLEPDGTLVRGWAARERSTLTWDFLDQRGEPVAGGLYQVQVQGEDASGRPLTPQRVFLGVVRTGGG